MSNLKYPCVGFVGKAGHGKTTAGMALRSLGYVQAQPAAPLRQMLRVFLFENGVDTLLIESYLTGPLKNEIIPEIGKSGRELQQTLGTEWGREHVAQDVWTNMLFRKFKDRLFYNDSVRFLDEAAAFRAAGVKLVRIIRPETEAPKASYTQHVSELEQDQIEVNLTIYNNGTVADLARAITDAVKSWAHLREAQ